MQHAVPYIGSLLPTFWGNIAATSLNITST